MKKGRTLHRIAQMIDVPAEVLISVPRVEVVGHLQFRVENHHGLEAYESDRIVVRTPDGRLTVTGRQLVIGWIDRNEMLVTGQVYNLAFQEGSG